MHEAPDSSSSPRPRVALAHDYLTTLGGAERVVLSMVDAFPEAPLYTPLFEPAQVDPRFGDVPDIRTSRLNRVGPLRRNYRLALPVMAPVVSRMKVDAEVLVASSSGWAHGIPVTGKKIVYCHNPPRWVYQRSEYAPPTRPLWWATAAALHPFLRSWDAKAAAACDRYIANSSIVAQRIERFYGKDAEVLPPPTAFDPAGTPHPVDGVEPGFFLTVGRLIGHKNTAAVIEAFASLPKLRLVVAGDGPEGAALQHAAPSNVTFLGRVDDGSLRWLYANAAALVSASREDFGLTPIEAASFGRPSILLRFGGFLDTMIEDETALFFDEPNPAPIAAAIRAAGGRSWDTAAIRANADRFSATRFRERLRAIVDEELSSPT